VLSKVVDYPITVAITVVVTTLIAGLGYYDPSWISRLFLSPQASESQQPAANDVVDVIPEALPNVNAIQLSDWDAILLVESKDLFTPSSASALRRAVDQLRELDYVEEVFWMEDAPPLNIFGLREPIFPKSTASAQRFAAAKDKAESNPFVSGFMLSDDAKATLLMIRFDWLFVQGDEDVTSRLRETAERAAQEIAGSDLTFRVTGAVPLRLALIARNRSNELTYQILADGFILIMAAFLFRGITAVIIVAIPPGLGVFWTLGMLHYFDFEDNPFNSVVLPIMITLVGFTDGVHMMVQIRTNRAAGHSRKEAARLALREVGLACFLTSLTTAIGFGSLELAHHPVVREFGRCSVIGVAVTFVAVVTVIPLLCLTPLGERVQTGHGSGFIDRHFGRAVWMVDWVIKRRRMVAIAGLVVVAAMSGLTLMLEPDERRTSSLPTTGEAMESMRAMDDRFGGLEIVEFQVAWDESRQDGSPELLEVLQEIDGLLQSEKLIGHPMSLANLIAALPGEGPPAERVSMIELLPPPLKRSFYVPERNFTRGIFRVKDLGVAAYGPTFERVERGLAEIAARHPGYSIWLNGGFHFRWKEVYQVVVDLAMSLGTASFIIFLVLAVVYRSLRLGLISIVPNVLPLAATGTVLYFLGQPLEMVTVCAFTICLGIAVDDTIHFLTRYQEETKKGHDDAEAVRRAFVSVGTAMIMTTVVLTAGFAVALTSDTRDHRVFALMAMMTISTALIGDLIVLPAMLVFFQRRRRRV
jgi:predicted RND superfamily exporter protein